LFFRMCSFTQKTQFDPWFILFFWVGRNQQRRRTLLGTLSPPTRPSRCKFRTHFSDMK
jgi:hypothetical protein